MAEIFVVFLSNSNRKSRYDFHIGTTIQHTLPIHYSASPKLISILSEDESDTFYQTIRC